MSDGDRSSGMHGRSETDRAKTRSANENSRMWREMGSRSGATKVIPTSHDRHGTRCCYPEVIARNVNAEALSPNERRTPFV
jgi:hypothetical protein